MTRFRFFMLLVVIFAAVVLLYVMPRAKGDSFVQDMLKLDVVAMQSHLCPDTSLAQVMGLLSGAGGEVGRLITTLTGTPIGIPGRETFARTFVPESAYYPFTGAYVFRLTLAQNIEIGGFKLNAGFKSPEMALTIGRTDILHPCVRAG